MKNTIENAKAFVKKELGRSSPLQDYMSDMLVAYANSVRPELKLPSEKEYDFDPWTNGWNACLAEIKRLNRID